MFATVEAKVRFSPFDQGEELRPKHQEWKVNLSTQFAVIDY
jgi:hypothetical protein